jgi:hypothetical protein
MTHPSERMERDDVPHRLSEAEIDYAIEDGIRNPQDGVSIGVAIQLMQERDEARTDLAVANERAEKAENHLDQADRLHHMLSCDLRTLRTQLAEAVEALIELEDIGIASMTLLEGSHLHKKMDIAVDNARVVISANSGTISRLTRDAAASPKNPDADASGEGVGK